MDDIIAIWVLVALFVGAGIGYFLSNLALVFFDDKIFDWIGRCRGWVRKKVGMD